MKPTFFATPAKFRAWLEAHHESEQELVVGFFKKGTGKPSITWPESVSAKREETRERRFAQLIADSEAGRTIQPLTRPEKPTNRAKR